MALDISVKLPRKLRESIDAKKRSNAIVEAVAFEAERVAKTLAPVDHGRLRASIEGGVDAEGGFVKAQTEYAAFQEFGTTQAGRQTDPGPTPAWYQHGDRAGGVPAHPFLRPAVAQVSADIVDIARRSKT